MLEGFKAGFSYTEIKQNSERQGNTVKEIIPNAVMEIERRDTTTPVEMKVGPTDPIPVTQKPLPISPDQDPHLTDKFYVVALAVPIGDTKSIMFYDPETFSVDNIKNELSESYGSKSISKVLDIEVPDWLKVESLKIESLDINTLNTKFQELSKDIKSRLENLFKSS